MKTINYVAVPAFESEDINRDKTEWKNGKCISIDEGDFVTLYVGHHTEETITLENGSEYTPVKAFPIRVMKPVNRDMAINAAEMEAYCLNSAMEVASFSASMARKHRENSKDQEVKEHDAFISWVKEELTKIGY